MDLKDEARNIYHIAFSQLVFQTLHVLHTRKIDSDKCNFTTGIFFAHTQEYRNYVQPAMNMCFLCESSSVPKAVTYRTCKQRCTLPELLSFPKLV